MSAQQRYVLTCALVAGLGGLLFGGMKRAGGTA